MAERDFAEIAKLSEKYNKDPKSRIFVQLADAYRKNKMIDEALEILNKGLEHHPQYPLAYLILGKCYFDKRSYAQAKDSFEKTLSHDAQNIVALRMLAQTCKAMKDETGQIAAYKGILALDPFDGPAKEGLDKLEAAQKKEPIYTVTMAEEYEKQGNVEKALSVYEHLLFTDPTDLVLQQKVKELKGKIGREAEKIEEGKIEGLQVEAYFRPEELEPTKEPVSPEQPAPVSEPSPVQPPPAPESAPVTEESPPGEKEDEQILPLEEFLTEEITEPAKEKEVAPSPKSEQETAAHVSDKPADEVEEKLDILQPFTAEKVSDMPTKKLDILEPAETVSESPPPEEKTEEEAARPEEKPAPLPEIKEEAALEPETPAPLPEIKEEAARPEEKPAPLPEIKEEAALEPEIPAPLPEIKEEAARPEEKPAPMPELKEETTPPEEKVEEKKETPPSKPKEEDFQSFQDWLSGLLK